MENELMQDRLSNLQTGAGYEACHFTTPFDYGDKATVTYTYYSLRHLPYTVLMDVIRLLQKDIDYDRRKCNGSTRCIERCTELL